MSSDKPVNTRIPMLSEHTVHDRIERPAALDGATGKPRRKTNLSIDTALVPVQPSPAAKPVVVVTEAGSLRGDGLSVGISGLRIHNQHPGGPRLDSWQPAAKGSKAGVAGSSGPSTPSADEGRLSLSELKVESELGSGSSGHVRLVRHTPTSELFAMKVITLGCETQELRQILVELRTLHKSDVPGIISFMDAFYADNAVHIVLEFMDRGNLAMLLRERGPLPEWVLSHVAASVLAALTHLHQQLKVVHRDIKPSNVLINSAGEIKLADCAPTQSTIHRPQTTRTTGRSTTKGAQHPAQHRALNTEHASWPVSAAAPHTI